MNCKEVIYVSDTSGTIQSIDPRIGTIFVSYRGLSSTQKNSLAILNDDYLLASDPNKPLLTAWPLNSQEPISGPKCVLPGKVTALATSPDGIHIILSIDAKIYVYQISGVLLGVISKHYRGITKLVFLDSAHFVSCGENGAVMVWGLATAFSRQLSGSEPVYSFSHHSLPVTDVYAGGGLKSRLYTSSLDQTVKMYCLRNGELLLSVAFGVSITAIRLNCIGSVLYAGTVNGEVLEFCMDPLPRSLVYQSEEKDLRRSLEGHKKAVTALVTSMDGQILISGSEDATIIVWDIPSGQLLRVFPMNGPISAVIIALTVTNLFTDNFLPQVEFQNFERVSSDNLDSWHINVMVNEHLKPIEYGLNEVKIASEDVRGLKEELALAKQKNRALYEFAVQKILNGEPLEKRKKKESV